MELYGYEIQREKDLSHHGILGQKWGKQNGPPYPLDAKDHSTSEKKAGWRQSLKDVGKTIKTSDTSMQKNESADSISEIKTIQKIEKENDYSRVKEIIQSKEFKVALGIGIGVIATYAAYKLGNNYIKKAAMDLNSPLGKMVHESLMDQLTDLPKHFTSIDDLPKSNIYSIKDPIKLIDGINKNGFGSNVARINNCTFCTSSIIMRLKGYEVAASETINGFTANITKSWWNNADLVKVKTNKSQELVGILKNLGDGRYGELEVKWKSGGGHSMAFLVDGGKLKILDGQINSVFEEGSAEFKKLMSLVKINESVFMDLTDATPTDLILHCIDNV